MTWQPVSWSQIGSTLLEEMRGARTFGDKDGLTIFAVSLDVPRVPGLPRPEESQRVFLNKATFNPILSKDPGGANKQTCMRRYCSSIVDIIGPAFMGSRKLPPRGCDALSLL